jgi:hypothetical protein
MRNDDNLLLKGRPLIMRFRQMTIVRHYVTALLRLDKPQFQ